MDVSGIPQLSALQEAARKAAAGHSVDTPGIPAQEKPSVPFSQVFTELLNRTESEQQNVDAEVQRVLTGETSNLHEVSMAIARADLSFRFMMEIRDQLIGTYREVMKMQI